jgi:hypothetical protein
MTDAAPSGLRRPSARLDRHHFFGAVRLDAHEHTVTAHSGDSNTLVHAALLSPTLRCRPRIDERATVGHHGDPRQDFRLANRSRE